MKVKNSQIITTNYHRYAESSYAVQGPTLGTFENVVLRGSNGDIWRHTYAPGFMTFKNAALYCRGDQVSTLQERIDSLKLRTGGYNTSPMDINDFSGIWKGPIFKKSYFVHGYESDGFTVLSSVASQDYPWAFWPHDAQPEGLTLPITVRWEQGMYCDSQKVYASTDEALVLAKDPSALKSGVLGPDANSFTLPTTGMSPNQKWFWSIESTNDSNGVIASPPLEILTFDGRAKEPVPTNNTIAGTDLAGTVKWTVNGTWVNLQHVFLGTSAAAVEAATAAVPGAGVTLVTINNGTTNTASMGLLPLVDGSDKPIKYYWRVDGSGTVYAKGFVWNWTMADHYLFDGFETYTDYTTLHNTWTDGDTNFDSGAYINLNEAGVPVRSGSKSADMNL